MEASSLLSQKGTARPPNELIIFLFVAQVTGCNILPNLSTEGKFQ